MFLEEGSGILGCAGLGSALGFSFVDETRTFATVNRALCEACAVRLEGVALEAEDRVTVHAGQCGDAALTETVLADSGGELEAHYEYEVVKVVQEAKRGMRLHGQSQSETLGDARRWEVADVALMPSPES